MKSKKEPVEHVPPYEASKEDWEDFFKEETLPEDTFNSLDPDDEWMRLAGEYGGFTLQQTDERLAEQARKPKGPSPRYELDW